MVNEFQLLKSSLKIKIFTALVNLTGILPSKFAKIKQKEIDLPFCLLYVLVPSTSLWQYGFLSIWM